MKAPEKGHNRAQSLSDVKRFRSHTVLGGEKSQVPASSFGEFGPATDGFNSRNPSLTGSQSRGKRIDIDFTFNTIKDVKKVAWKDSAPWYREIFDGFCWLAYC